MKHSFYKELECVFNKILKCNLKILLWNVNATVGREYVYKQNNWEWGFTQICKDHGLRVVSFHTSKNFKSAMFPHCNIHKFTWTSPRGKNLNQTDHILTYRRRNSSVLDVHSFRAAACPNLQLKEFIPP
jgi:hypothetical protein